jgi:hypothetical protein
VKVRDVAGSDAGRDDAMRMCAMWWRRWRLLVSTIDVAQGKGSRSSVGTMRCRCVRCGGGGGGGWFRRLTLLRVRDREEVKTPKGRRCERDRGYSRGVSRGGGGDNQRLVMDKVRTMRVEEARR